MKEIIHWPGWFYGPNGEAEIFENEKDVPAGWADSIAKAEPKKGPGRPKKVEPVSEELDF